MQRSDRPADYDQALAYLYGRINYERAPALAYSARQFRLDRMRRLLAEFGDPHQGMPIVHVAGTKGKGSTAAMIAAVLTSAGYRTGLFTSPHLVDLEERVAIDGVPCTPKELVGLVERIRPVADAMDAEAAETGEDSSPTYFELTTLMALVSFAQRRVQATVLEVGLGGRLDSTNVCTPRVSVITSISFDHTRQLGNTLAEIAYEKGGIVKPGVPVVSGVTDDEPREVIERICAERGSRLVQLDRDFDYEYIPAHMVDHFAGHGKVGFRYSEPGVRAYHALPLGLLGRHQAANASVAIATIAELRKQGWTISDQALRAGLAGVRPPARIEVIGRHPTVIIDGAHNVASVAALVATLEESFAAQSRILIFATTQDKDVRQMMSLLLPRFDAALLTRYGNNPRGVPVEDLLRIAAELGAKQCRAFPDAAATWHHAKDLLTSDHLLCVTGSFFIAAEIREEIARAPMAQPAAALRPA
jgi:dihydrofolate synthase/folylpolyglutamate synthase